MERFSNLCVPAAGVHRRRIAILAVPFPSGRALPETPRARRGCRRSPGAPAPGRQSCGPHKAHPTWAGSITSRLEKQSTRLRPPAAAFAPAGGTLSPVLPRPRLGQGRPKRLRTDRADHGVRPFNTRAAPPTSEVCTRSISGRAGPRLNRCWPTTMTSVIPSHPLQLRARSWLCLLDCVPH
jgi:hypothetical protein